MTYWNEEDERRKQKSEVMKAGNSYCSIVFILVHSGIASVYHHLKTPHDFVSAFQIFYQLK